MTSSSLLRSGVRDRLLRLLVIGCVVIPFLQFEKTRVDLGPRDLLRRIGSSWGNFHKGLLVTSAFLMNVVQEVFWGRLSVFAAERRLLANALLDPANERFVLISESCIPITSLPVAYKYFMETDESFVHSFYDPGKGGLGRYNRIKGSRKMNPEVPPGKWRKGSQWFELTRQLAVIVVSDKTYYPKFETTLCNGDDHVCYIDEHYLPTVLTILAPSKLANRTSHYLDFSRSTAHPKQWEGGEIDPPTLGKMTTGHSCIYNGNLTETCYMFARKFSPGALEPLLELAAASFGIP